MGLSRSKAGMTLIELMVVVTIIGLSMLAFSPGIRQAMADRRCATATMELARLGRRARSEAIGLQRAMLVHVAYGLAPNQTARMRLLRGNVTRCDAEDWPARVAACPANIELERTGSDCLESIDLNNSHWHHAPFVVTVGMWQANETPTAVTPAAVVTRVARGATGEISICYEPSSMVRWAVAAPALGSTMNFSALNDGAASGGGLMFAVGLYESSLGELANTPRVVLFPLAGTPRRLR
jgi:prepilin-type N-terminal cleavage/methylation domain-containing protein